MVLDGHIHIHAGQGGRETLVERMKAAGVDGGVLISASPRPATLSNAERLADLLAWCRAGPELYPFYWIDPLQEDALDQVTAAVARGVAGFKVICSHHYPGDERAMPVYRAIAAADKPILFHSGILWDGQPSAKYNRPGEFEALLEVDGLKFCLAHISWPWCDELIAVYGKFLNAYTRRPDLSVEMYVDITPGTPPIYRREALTKLFTVGYDVAHNVLFGSDCNANHYNVSWVQEWTLRDRAIFQDLGLDQETVEGIYAGNLQRFLGLSTVQLEKRSPVPAE
jgi:predicted TIM-barrel fold metal-dependent hydrolase